jgi:hypothetical protein
VSLTTKPTLEEVDLQAAREQQWVEDVAARQTTLAARWTRLSTPAMRVLGYDHGIEDQRVLFMLWELQFWRDLALDRGARLRRMGEKP